jgi:hypothetical protein
MRPAQWRAQLASSGVEIRSSVDPQVSFQGTRNLRITSRLFTTCRSRAKPGAGMSAPFTANMSWNYLRGKAARTRGRGVK